MKLSTSLSVLTSIMVLLFSCSKSNDGGGNTDCTGVATSFSVNVNPIIQTFCNQAACHDAASTNGPGPITNYVQVFNNRSQIRAQVQAGLMPQNTTLTAAQKAMIICWIDSGAPNN